MRYHDSSETTGFELLREFERRDSQRTPTYFDPRFGLYHEPYDIDDPNNYFLPTRRYDRDYLQTLQMPYSQQPTVIVVQQPMPQQIPVHPITYPQVPPTNPPTSNSPSMLWLILFVGFLGYFLTRQEILIAKIEERDDEIRELKSRRPYSPELHDTRDASVSGKRGDRLITAKDVRKQTKKVK